MISVGGFREGEINGKPFHIFNFLSQTDTPTSSSEAAIDSGDDEDFPPFQPLFVLTFYRWMFSLNPYFFNKRSGDKQFRFLIGSSVYHHTYCVYHPYVIRISRHHHRVSFTSSPPSKKLICGVCRRKVDSSYGAYACNKCDDYFVHTKCALRKDLWDGKELEGIPEEPEMVVEPLERFSDGVILHFSHDHRLKLEISGAYDEEKFCQACSLPIYEGSSYYSCMDQCDFILHEACAKAPFQKQHAIHAHSLTLKKVGNIQVSGGRGHFYCWACGRLRTGFVYEDPNIYYMF
ncbi:BnaCnng07910D [Brassica napus]|uniref:BnaCnng07910D protein n=1 Tax=Brassica napus TaxID=3708 RepID=A0A078HH12_BRANA|nr:BnaCnng07910D [Brassica napus]